MFEAIVKACGVGDAACLNAIWECAIAHKAKLGALVVGLGGLASLYVAANSLRLTLKRARLEIATNLLYNWTKELDFVANRAFLVVTSLPKETLEAVYNRQAVAISSEYYESIVTILGKGFPPERLPPRPKGIYPEFRLSAEHSNYIRFQCVSWLNRLEAIVTAWQDGSADQMLMGRVFGQLILNYRCELEKLRTLKDTKPDLPVLSDFHEQLMKYGCIRVQQNLSVMPRWLPPIGSRLIVWPPTPNSWDDIRRCDTPTCTQCPCAGRPTHENETELFRREGQIDPAAT